MKLLNNSLMEGNGFKVSIEEVRAAKWIEIELESQVTAQATWLNLQTISVELKGHLSARVQLAPQMNSRPQKHLN